LKVEELRVPKFVRKEIEELKKKIRGNSKRSVDDREKEKGVFSEELEEKLKRLVEEKRRIVHFEDDIVYEMVITT